MYDDPSIENDDYAFYPPPVEDSADSYDQMMGRALDDRFVVVVSLPERGSIYWGDLAVAEQGRLRSDDLNRRVYAAAHSMALLGQRVRDALTED